MKTPAQILLLLVLFSLLALYSAQVTVVKSSHSSVSVSSSESEESGEQGQIPGGDAFNACDPKDRPHICTADFNPVCGYINRCRGGECTSTFANGCEACSNSHVSGYVEGSCADVQTTCDPLDRPQICPLIFTATCAVAARCRGPYCFENTSSSCTACSMIGVDYSLPGVCPGPDKGKLRQSCDTNNRPGICTADFNPVCAHLSNCVGRECWSTAGNPCSACANGNVNYYLLGECPEFVGPNEEAGNEEGLNEEGFNEEGFTEESVVVRTDCDANNRPDNCTADFTPVCAHTSGCQGDEADCTRTEANGCSACSHQDVDYYTDGQCPS